MNIGIDARLTYYRVGGISTYIRQMISALEQLDDSHTYTIFHSRKMHDETLSTRFRRADLWTPCHHRLERTALSVELARFRLDILLSPDFIPPWRGARRHVITIHDLAFLYYPQFMTDESRRYYNGQIEYAVNHADHILVNSQCTRQDLMTRLNVPGDKISIQVFGTDESMKPPAAELLAHWRDRLGLPETYILFLGTIEPRKNIGGLLEAYAGLLRRLPDAPPLVLAGRPGWLYEETLSRIDSLGLQNHVLRREDVPQESLAALYGGAMALVLPSFYEGFGFPALEAMACGTVPIVSNRASLPEVVGDVGLQIDPDNPDTLTDALYHVLTDSQWRAEQERAGIVRAAEFSWSKAAETALTVFRALA